MNVCPPKKQKDKFIVEVVYYPELRSIETFIFDEYEEAFNFYKQNRKKLKLQQIK